MPPHKTNRRLQLATFLLLFLFTALAAPSAARAATAPKEPASDDLGVYLLSEPGHLLWFRDTVNGGSAKINAKLTKDIDLSEGGSPSHWTPIGQYISGERKDNGYAGSFDGGGLTVSGYIVTSADVVSTNDGEGLAAGFFGLVGQKAEIRGLTVGGGVSVDISNSTERIRAGGIAGYNYGTITNNTNSGRVSASGDDNNAGGIAGCNDGGTITNNANGGDVSASGGNNYAGGIAGWSNGTITNNTNSGGDVSASGGDNNAGGIAGYNYNGTITNNVHNGGDVSASGGSWNRAGGIAGCNFNDSTNGSSTITNNTHSGGDVSASGGGSDNRAGGIAGGNSGGTITNNAHNGGGVSASGGSNRNSAGGITGYNFGGTISNSCWLDSGDLKAVGNETTVRVDVVSLDAEAMKKVVTTVLPMERTLSVEIGGSVPALISYPGTADDMTNYFSVSGDISVASPDIAGISGSWPCTVSGIKQGTTMVSFDINLRATDFSSLGSGPKPVATSCVTDPLSFTVAVSVPVAEVSLNLTELMLNIGESKKLTATVKPENATDKAVTWTSADPAVAVVDDTGKVTALSAGTTVVTAKAGEKSATCTVTVTKQKSGGSSHGCAAGLGALSMLTLIPLWLRKKR